MTFAEGVLRLVGAGARAGFAQPESADALEPADILGLGASEPSAVELFAVDDLPAEPTAGLPGPEPGFSDIEAAVALVESGLATRVVLTGFPSWPGLLWQAYQLAEVADVLILPTVVRPGGRVDIVVARETRTDG